MKHIFFLLTGWVLLSSAYAQTSQTGAEVCADGKIRYFGKLFQTGQASGRQIAPTVQAVGDSTIDVTYYGLNLRLSTAPNYLHGATTVTVKANVPTLSQFYLDFNTTMRVDSVTGGNPARRLTFAHANNRLTITLLQTLGAGQTGRVTVFYQGLPVSADGAFVFTTHGPGGAANPLIYTLSQPYGASDWFPCKDTPADKVDSSAVNITAPPLFVSTSNGLLQGITTNADGTRTYRWKNSYTIAQYLISIACSNYEQYDTPPFTHGGRTMPVVHYLFPEVAAAVKPAVNETNDMLRVFSDLFGTYPFMREKYGHAGFAFGGGMEHQTLSSMGSNAFTRGIIAHELGHQWFGDKITCRNWQNIWLNEGFASYTEAAYVEAINGPASYRNYMGNFITQARRATGTLYVQNVNSVGQIFDYNRSYAKGAVVLHMLRGVLGDSTFYRGMRAYATSPVAYSTAVTEDFQRSMETASGKNLGYFFREWVYGEGYPTYSYSVAPVANTNRAVVRILQPTGTNPTSFTMPVQITVQSLSGDSTVTVFNDQPVQSFTVTGRGAVTNVVIDPNNWILKATTVQQVPPPVEPVILATEESPLLHVFPNPGNDLLTAEFTTQTAGPLTISLVNLLGQPIASHADTNVPAGKQVRTLSLRGVQAGRYVVRLQTADGLKSAAVLVK